MKLRTIANRLRRVARFTGQAASLSAVPALAIAAIARDNPYGHGSLWGSVWGRLFGIVNVRTKTVAGAVAAIDTHDLGQLISCEEILIERTYDLTLVPFEPEVIVDCGAHIGLFSLMAGLRHPAAEILAFEPDAQNCAVVRTQLARLGRRVQVVNAALAAEAGEAWFYKDASNSGYLAEVPAQLGEARQRVRTLDLSDEASRWAGKRLLMKMDIEGAEMIVLPRIIARLPHDCALFYEAHGRPRVRDDLAQALASAGFAVTTVRERDGFSDHVAIRHGTP